MFEQLAFELEDTTDNVSNEVYKTHPHIAWLAVSSGLSEESAATVVSAAFGIGWHSEQYRNNRFSHRPEVLDVWRATMQDEMGLCRQLSRDTYRDAKCLSREVFRLFYTLDELTSPSFLAYLQEVLDT